nr:apolipoprotein N-acyltransferase [Tychonema bourrellyi]
MTLWGAALVVVWAWLFAIASRTLTDSGQARCPSHKNSGTGILPVISKNSGTGILPVISKNSGTGILPVISKNSGTGILPVISKNSGTGILPVISKMSGTGILAVISKMSGTGILPVTRVLIGTALWCALESFWSQGSLWWTSLSYTQSPHNLAILHLGQISGPSAVTAAIVAVNGLIAEAWIEGSSAADFVADVTDEIRLALWTRQKKLTRNTWILYLLPAILCLILHIAGGHLYNRPLIQEARTALKIGIIQGNIPNEIKFDSKGWRRALEGYTAGYQKLADRGVDAVLTPETALPFFWTNEYQRSTLSFYQAILDRGILALVGGFGQEGDGMTNSLLAIDKTGEIISRYDKTKLVPLGEYIPFYEILGGMINRLSPLDAHLVPGNPKQLFDTPFGRAIVGICYDSAFSEIFRYQAANGGEFMLTASNNAHYKPPMLAQHHALDVMRAIETDRWAAIATNTGYSAVVNPHGETLWMSGINTYEVKDATIYRRQTQTLYVRWGDLLTPLLLVLAGLGIIWQRIP